MSPSFICERQLRCSRVRYRCRFAPVVGRTAATNPAARRLGAAQLRLTEHSLAGDKAHLAQSSFHHSLPSVIPSSFAVAAAGRLLVVAAKS
jgi:hypothetical protein